MYGKIQESGLTKINTFICISANLGPMSCLFHILSFLGAHHRECLKSEGCKITGIILLPECPQGSPGHTGGLQALITVTSLLTDAGNIPFLSSY